MGTAMKSKAKGKFEIFKGKGGKFYFRLKAANNQIILQSQGYKGMSGATTGVKSVKRNASSKMFEIRKSKKGDPYFVLLAKGGVGSGAIIGSGETYQGGLDKCKKGIASVIKNKGAPVVEV